MNPFKCKHCGRIPTEHPADVISECLCVYYRCQCGATGPWRRTRDDAAKLWNEWHGKKDQPTRAKSVLAHKKEELAYAG